MEDKLLMMQYFFELLQVALGRRKKLSGNPSEKEWTDIFNLCEQQSLLGIGFIGVQKLQEEQLIQTSLLQMWTIKSTQLTALNRKISTLCRQVVEQLEADGFVSCILKGQGNICNYGEELGLYRQPGDIDVLMRCKNDTQHELTNNDIHHIVDYAKQVNARKEMPIKLRACYHHVDLPLEMDSEIEAHYRAIYMNTPWKNKTLQKWLNNNQQWNANMGMVGKDREGKEIWLPIPTPQYNIVFQLGHIFKHFFEFGIGMRQILDYYMVLKTFHAATNTHGTPSKEEMAATLHSLSMDKFAKAVMYVLKRVLDMPDEYILCGIDEKAGKRLLSEIMMAGNFGLYDKRMIHSTNRAMRAIDKLMHNLRLVSAYPDEALSEPFFRLWHWMWRKQFN